MPASATKSALSEYLLSLYATFSKERSEREKRWNESRDNFHRVFKSGALKDSEGEGWRSKYTSGTVPQKVRTLYALLIDSALQNGSVPFKMFPKNPNQHDAEALGYTAEEAAQEASEKVAEAFERCHADRTYMGLCWSACMYGENYGSVTSSVFTVPSYASVVDPITGQVVTWQYKEQQESGDSWDHVSVWDMFCDPEANFDPRKGRGCMRRVMMSPSEVRRIAGAPLYDRTAMLDMLKDKAASKPAASSGKETDSTLPPYLRSLAKRGKTIRMLEFWGEIPRSVRDAWMEQDATEGKPFVPVASDANDDGDVVYVHVVLQDDVAVRVTFDVEPADNPYYRGTLEDIPDEPEPLSVADNSKDDGELLSGLMRLYIDNKAWSANVQTAIKSGLFKRVPDKNKPGGTWELNEDAQLKDAWQQIIVQDVGESLLNAMALAEKYGDWNSMMAKISQGQIEKNATTATEIQEQARRADSYTGTVIRNFDEQHIEPVGTRFFRNMMTDPDSKLKKKADLAMQALGFETYQDRTRRVAALAMLIDLAAKIPQIDAQTKWPGLWEPMVRAQRVDPRSVILSEDEKRTKAENDASALAKQNAPPEPAQPPEPPEETAARIDKTRAEADRARADAQSKLAKVKLDAVKLASDARKPAEQSMPGGQAERNMTPQNVTP